MMKCLLSAYNKVCEQKIWWGYLVLKKITNGAEQNFVPRDKVKFFVQNVLDRKRGGKGKIEKKEKKEKSKCRQRRRERERVEKEGEE